STTKAMKITMALSCPISAFSLKLDIANTEKPATKTTVVIHSARPTV
ncbi:hypothetical protein D046_0809B, partial [Vibrio parahaemolyticus V-223/04]